MTKTLTWGVDAAPRPWRAVALHLLADLLRSASDALGALAVRAAQARESTDFGGPVEFHDLHRDAGAPEGALYVNGKLVGVISGVTRL